MKSQKTVVLGLSGGVDSAVAALLLKKQGYRVIGAFMKNFSDNKNPLTGECNWVEEKKMAQKISALLKIPLVTFDFEKQYKRQVLEPMYKSYQKGLTPNPDISCNTIIKFPLFWQSARKLGADYIAMGHYARIKKTKSGFQLLSGKDKTKDQSYFLSELSQSDLSHTLFPIGNLTKSQIRSIAKKNKFPNWDKKSTSGICFVGKIPLQKFLRDKIKSPKGNVLDTEGNIIGRHSGIGFYTLGQRIGPHIGIDIKKPKGQEQEKWYVADKIFKDIIAVPENHSLLFKQSIFVKNLHLINSKDKRPEKLRARIRHLGELNSGILLKDKSRWKFIFSKPIKGIAPGQSLVLYDKHRVVASGEISLK